LGNANMTAGTGSPIHRRHVVTGIGAALAAPIFSASFARAATAPFRRKVGAIEVIAISDGVLNVPLSISLPQTPQTQAAALFAAHGLPPEGHQPQLNITLVKTGSELILIDAGAGSNFQATAGKLEENMKAAAIDPASVTKVVFTHGHADHLWGAIDDFDELRFPNASYVISKQEWEFWRDPNTPAKIPDPYKGMAIGSARILKRLESKMERRMAGDALAPGVTYVETFGHTPGHMAVMIASAGQNLLIGGDVLTNVAVSFARPEWRLGADYDHDRGVATRKRLLDRLTTDRIPLLAYHLPWPGHGMVERAGAAYRFVPR
jgi:glyoxylase-like metal-dependent hydrolase (beta-lactamase superfamily II)